VRQGLAAALLLFAMHLAGPVRAEQSLASLVPRNVGLFMEGRELGDLLAALTEPAVWLGLAELAGQPARQDEVELWRQQLRDKVGMEPSEAIQVLLLRQFALVASGPGGLRDAVLLCRPTVDTQTLLGRCRAQPLPSAGRTSVYRLSGRLGLALPEGLAMFGDAEVPDGTFQRLLEYLDAPRREPSLAEDAHFQRLMTRVPPDPDGLVFVRLQPTVAGGRSGDGGMLGPLRGSTAALLALHRQNNLLRLSVVGDTPPFTRHRPGLARLCRGLPARTLLAWGMHLDYSKLLASAEQLPERSLFRVVLRLHDWASTVNRLTVALGSATCVTIGTVDPEAGGSPPVPALAVLIAAEQPEVVAAEFERAIQTTISAYNLLSLRVGSDRLLSAAEQVLIDGRSAGLADLSPLLRGLALPEELSKLQFCWVVDDDALIMASHVGWLEQILRARHGRAPDFGPQLQRGSFLPEDGLDTVIAVQAAAVADLGQLWLDYLARKMPQVLEERWWRARQPGGGQAQLGILVTELAEERRLQVARVLPRTPADGILLPGDEIVGYGRRRFATTQPVGEMRQALEQRPDARWIDLLVERGGTTIVVRVPLPFVDPVALLRRAVARGRIAQQVTYREAVGGPEGPRGELAIELRTFGQAVADTQPGLPTTAPRTQTAPASPTAPAAPGE
jgi:hypothetical protein